MIARTGSRSSIEAEQSWTIRRRLPEIVLHIDDQQSATLDVHGYATGTRRNV